MVPANISCETVTAFPFRAQAESSWTDPEGELASIPPRGPPSISTCSHIVPILPFTHLIDRHPTPFLMMKCT
jgi:hypothetical protein